MLLILFFFVADGKPVWLGIESQLNTYTYYPRKLTEKKNLWTIPNPCLSGNYLISAKSTSNYYQLLSTSNVPISARSIRS